MCCISASPVPAPKRGGLPGSSANAPPSTLGSSSIAASSVRILRSAPCFAAENTQHASEEGVSHFCMQVHDGRKGGPARRDRPCACPRGRRGRHYILGVIWRLCTLNEPRLQRIVLHEVAQRRGIRQLRNSRQH